MHEQKQGAKRSTTHPSSPTTASLLDELRWWWGSAVLAVATTHHLAVALLLGRWVGAGDTRWRLLHHGVALAVGVLVLELLRGRWTVTVCGTRTVVEASRTRHLLVLLGKHGLLVLKLLLADRRDAGRRHGRAVRVLGCHEAVRCVRVE